MMNDLTSEMLDGFSEVKQKYFMRKQLYIIVTSRIISLSINGNDRSKKRTSYWKNIKNVPFYRISWFYVIYEVGV
jgi:hypothetical protein